MTTSKPCSADDCDRTAVARGMCRADYQRAQRAERRARTPQPAPAIFEAVWPIVDPWMARDALDAEAAADLPAVAARSGVKLVGIPTFTVRAGRTQRGSQGAEYCLVAHCPAIPDTARAYRKKVAA